MNSTETTETKPTCVREIQVEVPAEVLTQETDSLLKRYTKVARIPGFRPGKVPPTVVKRQFGDSLLQEAAENIMKRVVPEELKKQNLQPVSQPRIADLHIHDGEPLTFKAIFEVMPDVEISDYKNLGPEPVEITVTDAEVEDALKNVQQQRASYDAVTEERPVTDGDFAQISLEGEPISQPAAPAESDQAKTEGDQPPAEGEAQTPAPEPVKVDEVMLEVGGQNTVKEFTENVRGMRVGEKQTFEVTYPQDFQDKRLAGTTFRYTIEVKGIKTKSVPELNDEFAKELGEFSTLEDVRKRIREGMEHERRHQAEHEAKDKIVDELVKKTDFPVPEALVQAAIDQRLDRGLRALAAQGMRPEDMKKMDFSRLRAGQRDAAIREVKASLILDKIAEMENIEVDDSEVDKEIAGLAAQYRQPVETVREGLEREGAIDRIRDSIRNQKTLESLYRRTI